MEEAWGEPVTRAWAEQFPIAPYRRLVLERQAISGGRALEVGSGPAHDSLTLAEHGLEVHGVDWSRKGLEAGRRLYAEEGRRLLAACCDIRSLPYRDGAFDFVWNGGVLEHFEDGDIRRVLSEMRRVTKSGGVVLATVPNRFYFWYQAHLRWKRFLKREHQYGFERALDPGHLAAQFRLAGFKDVNMTGIHLHPAPSFLIPKTGWATKLFARVFRPLEAPATHSPWRAYSGLDLVVWARK